MVTILSIPPHEHNRYIQQINLREIGYSGQLKLKQAKVLCIGAGGLGSSLLIYLAAAGVGTIGIVDHDRVELSNLHRQSLYQEQHVGAQKAVVAKHQLLAMNPSIGIHSYPFVFDEGNSALLLDAYDIMADCSDNSATRYLINDQCFKLAKPYAMASVGQWSGQCTVFLGSSGPCLRCLYALPPPEGVVQSCVSGGVMGVLPGLFGIIQATEILKWILQVGNLLAGRVFVADLLKMQFREFQLSVDPDCMGCAHRGTMAPYQGRAVGVGLSMKEYLISPGELKKSLDRNDDLQLIDVRTLEKHQAYNIGGRLLPFDELPYRLNELDSLKPVVTYCTLGNRSFMALQLLRGAGFTSVRSLDGGVTAWKKAFC